mmetsp:Transcript_77638/g.177782  ORF Transcript_77638/g.177782 Transcript_77638/m.177782 type:complete len:658 (-) Transcript_77638:256-2229(-)
MEVAPVAGDGQSRALFTDQRFSGRTGTTIKITTGGRRLATATTGQIALMGPAYYDVGARTWSKSCGDPLVPHTHAAAPAEAGGQHREYTVDGTGLAVGRYQVCFCEEQSTLSDAAGTSVVMLEDTTYQPGATAPPTDFAAAGVLATAGLSDKICTLMCNRGCSGAGCNCDDYDVANPPSSTVLCLDPKACRAACSSVAGCVGFVAHQSQAHCRLLVGAAVPEGPSANLPHSECFDTYRVVPRASCQQRKDFTYSVGELVVTRRPVLGTDWVLNPGEKGSLEILGTDLDGHKDRIMLISNNATCGSDPSAAAVASPWAPTDIPLANAEANSTTVDQAAAARARWGAAATTRQYGTLTTLDRRTPGDAATAEAIARYNAWLPHGDWEDEAVEATEEYVPPAAGITEWTTTAGSYCPGGNTEVSPSTVGSNSDEVAAVLRTQATPHQCYNLCSISSSSPQCLGFLPGIDAPNSTALCLPVSSCLALCAATPGCSGVDAHETLPRCFVNTAGSCPEGGLLAHADYDFHAPVMPQRRLCGRRLQTVQDPGYSCDAVLRFRDLMFRAGGTFKVCFCDHELLAPAHRCYASDDYAVELGTVHVSGVSCLLQNSRLRRSACLPQVHGGLRCYSGVVPATPVCTPEAPPPAAGEDVAAGVCDHLPR